MKKTHPPDAPEKTAEADVFAPRYTYQLLKSLDRGMAAELLEYAKSPMFCGEPARNVLEWLVKEAMPNFPADKTAPSQLYARAYKKAPFSAAKLNRLFSEINQAIEKYIAVRGTLPDPVEVNLHLLWHLAQSPDTALFEKALRKTQKSLDNAPESFAKLRAEYHFRQEQLAHKVASHQTPTPADIREAEAAFRYYADSVLALFEATGAQRANLINNDRKTAPSPAPPLLAELLQQLRALCLDPAAPIEAFEAIFQTLKSEAARIAPQEQEDIFQLLLGYCNQRFKSGDAAFGEAIVRLQTWANEPGKTAKQQPITGKKFLNAALGIGMSGDFKKMEQYIRDQTKHFQQTSDKEAVELAWAYWHFMQNNPAAALKHLKKLHDPFPLPDLKIRAHSLGLRAHFEVALKGGSPRSIEFRNLEIEMESYQKYFIRPGTLTKQQQKAYLDLLGLVKKLLPFAKKPGSCSEEARTDLRRQAQEANLQPSMATWLERMISAL